MNILVDENIPSLTVLTLRQSGHDVADLRGTSEAGLDDDHLWEKAQQQRRLLVTTDKGFVHRRDQAHHGILIVRLRQPNRMRIHERVMKMMERFSASEWPGLLVVVRDTVLS